MSPYMRPDLAPDPARERCGNCGEPWEEHESCGHEDDCRLCPDRSGREYRPESDEDRIADRAAAMEGGL